MPAESKSMRVYVRLTPAEWDTVKRLAAALDLSISDFIRKQLDPIYDKDARLEVLRERGLV